VAKSAADNLPSTSDVADKIMSDPDLAAKMSKSAVDSIANINDQAAKAAWAAVQKQVESGELTDHKRLSFALNRALNQAFSDFGTNPYSPGADFSKRAAREIIAKAKDTESLLAALQGGKTESVARVSKRISEHKIKIYQTRPLSEGQIYLLFDRVVENNVRLINEGVVVTSRLNEGPMDFLKKAAGKTVSKLSSFGKNLTTKVTASKLLSAWKKEGSPTDSEKLNSFLSAQGVAPEVIQSSFKSMNIQPPTGKQEPEADSSAAGSEKPAPADTDSAQSQKDNAATQDQSADKVAKDADGTAEKPAAPAGTIGLAQQGSTGSATAPASDKTATSKPEPADDQPAPTAAKATPADSQAAPAVGKVDVIGLAKMIKQQKPPVVDAIKKLLNSREAQRAD
jgi:hypothetical protein